MKKAKQLCSVILCIVMVAAFTITPVRAAETITILGTNSITETAGTFSEDKNVQAVLSNTTTPSSVTMEATIGYNDGTIGKAIKSDSVTKETNTANPAAEIIFKFKKADLNLLPAGTYNIKAKSTSDTANSVSETNIGTVTVNKSTPTVTIDKIKK